MSDSSNDPLQKQHSDDDSNRHLASVPEAPKLSPALPMHPSAPKHNAQSVQTYSKSMMASSAVTAFLMPIIVLCLGGYWLDSKLKHATPWFSILGVIVGLILGLTSMMRVLDKLSK